MEKELVLIGTESGMELVQLDEGSPGSMKGIHSGFRAPAMHQLTSVEIINAEAGLVAGGNIRGELQLARLPLGSLDQDFKDMEAGYGGPGASRPTDAANRCPTKIEIARVVPEDDMSHYPITALQYVSQDNKVLALRDRLDSIDVTVQWPGRLYVFDASTLQPVGVLRELLHFYELAAFMVLPEAPNEVLTTSVKLCLMRQQGDECERCSRPCPRALCFHQQRSAAAAFSTFDVRSGAMEHRIALPHRSIYPHIEVVRQHYVLLSHAGGPVSVWDRRYMVSPVHEEPPLDQMPKGTLRTVHCNTDLDEWGNYMTDALHLHAADGLLLGRSSYVKCYVWDLSTVMGWEERWQQGGCEQGRGAAGPWLSKAQPSSMPRNTFVDKLTVEK